MRVIQIHKYTEGKSEVDCTKHFEICHSFYFFLSLNNAAIILLEPKVKKKHCFHHDANRLRRKKK